MDLLSAKQGNTKKKFFFLAPLPNNSPLNMTELVNQSNLKYDVAMLNYEYHIVNLMRFLVYFLFCFLINEI